MNTYAIPALKEKRAQIAGRVISLKKQIARHVKELANLDATISLFDPSYKVGSIKPRNARNRSKLFKQGELGRLILDALRMAQGTPLATREVVAAVGVAIGQPEATHHVLAHSVRANLAYQERRKETARVGKGKEVRWELRETLIPEL
ncbi:hypothetical protein BH10PSE7_BH10PSE7_44690 [soil metagenome]